MDRKLRRFHKKKQNGGKPVEKKQRLRMMHAELSIEEQIQLAANNKLYSNRNPEKGIRIITVICYFFSISLAAIVLSVYYVYFFRPEYKNSTTIRNTNCDLAKEISVRTINATEMFYNRLLQKLRTREDDRKVDKFPKHIQAHLVTFKNDKIAEDDDTDDESDARLSSVLKIKAVELDDNTAMEGLGEEISKFKIIEGD